MAHAEASARTVDAAVTAAAAQLGLRPDQVDIEVLEDPVPSTFGYIGTPARVRVTPRPGAADQPGRAGDQLPPEPTPTTSPGPDSLGSSPTAPAAAARFTTDVGAGSGAGSEDTLTAPTAQEDSNVSSLTKSSDVADRAEASTVSEVGVESPAGPRAAVRSDAESGSDEPSGSIGPPDVAAVTADTASGTPDPAALTPDTVTITPDPTTGTPDIATVTSDPAAGTPDTPTVTPDTATATPANAGPTAHGAPDAPPSSVAGSDGNGSRTPEGGTAAHLSPATPTVTSADSSATAPDFLGAAASSATRPPRRTSRDEPVDPAMVEADTERAGDFLEGLLDALDVDGDITTWVDEVGGHIDLEGTDLDVLVGSNGETLDALQELTRLAVLRQSKRRVRLLLDINGFRSRHREQLVSIVKATAEQVIRTREDYEFQPMTPSERKIVHDAVAAIEGARTESLGEDPHRRVVIRPA